MRVRVCVISAGRPANVLPMLDHFPDCHWYVPAGQVRDYLNAGAGRSFMLQGVKGQLPMKTRQLNRALDNGFADGCDVLACVDDDLVKCEDTRTRRVVPLLGVVRELASKLLKSPYYLAGVYGGTNSYWASKETRTYGLVIGGLVLHRPCVLRYDTQLPCHEDIDYCVQHHVSYRGVLQSGEYCLHRPWQGQTGGYQGCRTEQMVAEACRRIVEKWGNLGCRLVTRYRTGREHVGVRVPWKKLATRR